MRPSGPVHRAISHGPRVHGFSPTALSNVPAVVADSTTRNARATSALFPGRSTGRAPPGAAEGRSASPDSTLSTSSASKARRAAAGSPTTPRRSSQRRRGDGHRPGARARPELLGLGPHLLAAARRPDIQAPPDNHSPIATRNADTAGCPARSIDRDLRHGSVRRPAATPQVLGTESVPPCAGHPMSRRRSTGLSSPTN